MAKQLRLVTSQTITHHDVHAVHGGLKSLSFHFVTFEAPHFHEPESVSSNRKCVVLAEIIIIFLTTNH